MMNGQYSRNRQGSTAASMTRVGAPAPSNIRMRNYYDTMANPEAAEAVVAGTCSTPSDYSSAKAASPYYGPSFHAYHQMPAALSLCQQMMPPYTYFSVYNHPMTALASSNQLQMMAQCATEPLDLPRGPVVQQMPPVPPHLEVRHVWQYNFAEELALIESLMHKFQYMAVDTEFPSTVYRPSEPAYMLTLEKQYALLRANVDELHLIQLGLTLFNDTTGTAFVWEFNFQEFDVQSHRHVPESIALLRTKGVDFDRTRREGVDAAMFGSWLRRCLSANLGRAGVVTFSGGYDMAFLVKAMFDSVYKLPPTADQFGGVFRSVLQWRNLFDLKEMALRCPGDLRGGLNSLAAKLNVPRVVGEAHQAGSDSLLTCHVFLKMKELFFDMDDKLIMVAGLLTDVTTS